MHIRPYRSSDCPALAELFYQTVHAVNARDYSPEQLDAWADGRVGNLNNGPILILYVMTYLQVKQ